MTAELLASPYAKFDDALRAISQPSDRDDLIRTLSCAVDRLNARDVDIVLLAARRMACFYALLRSCGLPNPDEGRVYSDRLLDLLPDNVWRGNKLLYLDDTKITGASETKGKALAARLVGSSGNVEYVTALGSVADSKSRRLHRESALAFGEHLTPFFVDFPVSSKHLCEPEDFGALLLSDRWRAVDVTNSAIAGTGSRAHTLVLADETMGALNESLGAASKLVEIAKVRLFSRPVGQSTEFRFVPLILTRPLSASGLTSWLGQMDVPISEEGRQCPAAVGAVTFVLSRTLGQAFSEILRGDHGMDVGEDAELADLATGALPAQITAHSSANSLGRSASKLLDDTNLSGAARPLVVGSRVGSVARYIVLGDDAVVPTYRSLAAAEQRVLHHHDGSWAKEALTLTTFATEQNSSELDVSLGIDVMNDLGVMVPRHRLVGGSYQRGYRSGEAGLDAVDDLRPGKLGGVLASVAHTIQYEDEDLA